MHNIFTDGDTKSIFIYTKFNKWQRLRQTMNECEHEFCWNIEREFGHTLKYLSFFLKNKWVVMLTIRTKMLPSSPNSLDNIQVNMCRIWIPSCPFLHSYLIFDNDGDLYVNLFLFSYHFNIYKLFFPEEKRK